MAQPRKMNLWRKARHWLPWLAVLVATLIGVNYVLVALPESPFRDLFLGNLLATVIGVVVGIPVALELARRQQTAEAIAKAEEAKRLSSRRRTQFLKMVQFSLLGNTSFLQSVAKNLIPGAAIYPNIDLEQLEATASLKYEILDDLRLAGQLDLVRFHLRLLQRLLDLSLDFLFSQTRFDLEPNAFLVEHNKIVERIHGQIPRALEVMTDAAIMIGKQLEADASSVAASGSDLHDEQPAPSAA